MIWDLVVVTARSAAQRWLFERYLGRLWPGSDAAGAPRFIVVQDPPGPQLGTAGATVAALCRAAQLLGDRLPRARVVILHCGGLSQRVPQLSHLGKAFAPGVHQEGDATLFAQIVAGLDQLFRAMEPGVVIACGDVLYRAREIGHECRRGEAVAVACPASAEQASRHGVYLWAAGADRVSDSWQKPAVGRLLELDDHRQWGLDTGILYLGARVVEAMLGAAGISPAEAPADFRRRTWEWCGVELYRDLTPPMTSSWDDTRRLPGAPGEVQCALSRFPLKLACPALAELLHFGTNEELLRIVSGSEGPRLFSSYVAAGDLAAGVVLDRCLSEAPIHVGVGTYLSGLSRSRSELRIGAGRIAYQLPVRAERGASARREQLFVAIGVSDNAKRPWGDGATLLGQPLDDWLKELGISREVIWEGIPEAERVLWNARLFPLGEGEAAADALPWLEDADDRQFGVRVDRWRRSARASMAEAAERFAVRRWWAHEQRIQACCLAEAIEAAVRRGDGVQVGELLRASGIPGPACRQACRRLRALGLAEPASLAGARAWLVAAALSPQAGESLRERGLVTLSRALVRESRLAGPEPLTWQVAPGEGVEARAPVRVDLAGGWTDTPPQACERGGAVLNLALQLDGAAPVMARVERLAEPVVELVAADLGRRVVLDASLPAPSRPDPRDPFAIHEAGLRFIGLLGSGSLPARLRSLGGGIRLTTDAQVPKGSGLGTSSILGAALLAALGHALGLRRSREELCGDVLRLEQMMGTGGGWQDQVGGMWGGIKVARSQPGLEQRPQVEPLALPPEVEAGLSERMLLFYTGEPRLARDVLQRVVSRYLTGDPKAIAALAEMPALVEQARAALLQGDWPALGHCLRRSWALNRQLEPTCSNRSLAALMERIDPFVTGAKLAGAGGGGFLFALARDRPARDRLEIDLAAVPPPARLYTPTLDRQGLVVRRVSQDRTA